MATACHEGRPTGTQAAGQRKGGDELRHNGYVLIKGKRLKNFKLQFGHIINEATQTTVQGKETTPPPAEEAKGLFDPS